MMLGLSANSDAQAAHEWSGRVLAFQLQVVLCAEDLGPGNSLLELELGNDGLRGLPGAARLRVAQSS